MQTHHLKLDKYYWDAVKSGEKPFEVRRDDRGFQRGDSIMFHKYDTSSNNGGFLECDGRYIKTIDGREIRTKDADKADIQNAMITYVLTGGQHGIEPGYVVIGIKLLKERGKSRRGRVCRTVHRL